MSVDKTITSDSMQTNTNDSVSKYLLKLTIPQLNELKWIVTETEFKQLKLIRRRANNRQYSRCSRANKAKENKPKHKNEAEREREREREHIIIDVTEGEQGEQGE